MDNRITPDRITEDDIKRAISTAISLLEVARDPVSKKMRHAAIKLLPEALANIEQATYQYELQSHVRVDITAALELQRLFEILS